MVSAVKAVLVGACLSLLLLPQSPEWPAVKLNDTPFVVKLLSPIDTRTAKAQNTFTTEVQEPPAWKGAYVEGRINHVARPSRGNGKAEIDFAFDTLTYAGRTVPITADLNDLKNSQGVSNVDDEGRVIGRSSQKKKIGGAAGGAALGGLVGGLTHGVAGAAAGVSAGAAAGYIIAAKLTSSGSEIQLAPGSTFSLRVSQAPERR